MLDNNRIKNILCGVLYALCFITSVSIFANTENNFKFQHLQLPDNIRSKVVNCFVQDNKGFMYIGLHSGLYRYDGHAIKEIMYTNQNNELSSLGSIGALTLDGGGRVWAVGSSGAFIYQPNTEITTRAFAKEGKNIIYKSVIVSKNNQIIIGTNKGLRIYDEDLKTYKSYLHVSGAEHTISHNVIRDIYEDSNNNLWIGTYNLLNKFDRESETFTHYNLLPSHLNKGKNNLVISIQPYKENGEEKLIIGTETGLVIFDISTSKFTYLNRKNTNNQISNDVVKTVGIFDDKTIWFGTDYGLNKYNVENKKTTSFFYQFSNENSIRNNVINTLYMDRQGNLWIGTNNGVDKIQLCDNEFLFNQINEQTASLRPGVEVNSFDEDSKGNIWFATNQGLIKYDNVLNEYIDYLPPQILHVRVNDIFVDKNDDVWLATSGGLNKYSSKYNSFKRYTVKANKSHYLTSNYISSVAIDNDDNVWVATSDKGLFKMVEHNGEPFFHLYRQNKNNLYPKDLIVDKQGYMWAVNNKSINKLNTNTGYFETVFFEKKKDNILIYDAFFDTHFWVATSKGLFKWNDKSNGFEFITDLDFSIKGLIAHNENLWLTSNTSLYRYSMKESSLNKIPKHKTPINDFKNKGFITSSNKILFSSYSGYLSFNPENISFETDIPKVHITKLQILGKIIEKNKSFYSNLFSGELIENVKEIKLKNTDNSFDISFSCLNLADSSGDMYSYKLEGYDGDWKTLTNGSNTAHYTRVNAGKYVFKVKAINPYGFQDENYTELAINIRQPLWASNGAITLYIFLTIMILLLVYKITLTREKLKNKIAFEKFEREKSEELIETKTTFFNSITHELKTPLTLIKTPVEQMILHEDDILKKSKLELINRNTNRIIRLVNQILDVRKFEKGIVKLEIQEYDIVKFCKTVFTQFENEAIQRFMNMNFYSNIQALTIWFDLDKMEKSLLNLLSNAYKFTPDNGVVSLILNYDSTSSNLCITVKDTGIGIKEEHKSEVFKRFSSVKYKNFTNQQGSGIGLSLVKEYVRLHSGTIRFKSEENVGSEFSINIPTDKNALTNFSEKPKLHFEKNNIEEHTLVKNGALNRGEKNKQKLLPVLLIIDDEKDIRNFLEESLKHKFRIITSKDGVEGLAMASKKIPDIIISDVMMPNMDGYELCKALKNNIKTSHIPVILLSAKSDSKSKLTGIEEGADDYVGKPFKLDYLITRANRLIKQREKLKKTFIRQHSIQVSEINVNSLDENFLNKVVKIIEDNIDNSELNVKTLSELLEMNKINLYRKIKGLTGQTAAEFIRTIRLKKAAQLLKTGQLNVKEVMYMVGFSHSSYFSRSFKEMYGIVPKDYK